jgi:TPR repeat protein
MDDIRECYRILDVEPGASFEDIKRSYRELVRVWHPDRFGNDAKLRAKAEEKLKRINLAYERLCKEAQEAGTSPAPEQPRAETSASHDNQDAKTTADAGAGAPPAATSEKQTGRRTLRRAGIGVAVLALILAIWAAVSGKRPDNAIQTKTPTIAESEVKATEKDKRNFEILRSRAENGDAEAQLNLGLMYADGEGVLQDFAKAFEWFQRAAAQGNAEAQEGLAIMYADGYGVQKDYGKAFEWRQRAAAQGNAVAQEGLGGMYANGQGVLKNEARAFEYYQKAAEQGHAEAQNYLECYYEVGSGTLKDEAKAFEWYQKAAERGNPYAQFNLGRMYADGRAIAVTGDPKDPEDNGPSFGPLRPKGSFRAYAWLNLAASKNVDGAIKLRDEVGKRLATDGKLKAQKLSVKLAEEIRLRKEKPRVQRHELKLPSAGNTPPPNKNSEPDDAKAAPKKSIFGPDGKIDMMATMPLTTTFKVAPPQVEVKVNANAKTFLEANTEASKQSQRLATAKYPDLKKEGSAFHTKFMELLNAALKDGRVRLDEPDWPMKFADMAATALRAYDNLNFGDSKEVVTGKLGQSTKLKPYGTGSIKAKPDEIDGAYYLDVDGEVFRTYFTFDKGHLAKIAFCSLPVDLLSYNGRVQVTWKAIRGIAILRFGEPTTTWGFPNEYKLLAAQGSQFFSDKWELEGKEVTVGVGCENHKFFLQLTITDKARKDAVKKAAAVGL